MSCERRMCCVSTCCLDCCACDGWRTPHLANRRPYLIEILYMSGWARLWSKNDISLAVFTLLLLSRGLCKLWKVMTSLVHVYAMRIRTANGQATLKIHDSLFWLSISRTKCSIKNLSTSFCFITHDLNVQIVHLLQLSFFGTAWKSRELCLPLYLHPYIISCDQNRLSPLIM
jgi:hypothetical protein